MITDIKKAIREYLPDVVHMSLATSADNKPWVCEVHFVYDQNLNLYFRSLASRRHSQEIAKNPYVAGNIVKQHTLNQNVRGVYFEGRAELLENVEEDSEVFRLFEKRLDAGKAIIDEAKQEDGHKFYKITVEKFYLFDSQESSPSQKYTMDWNK